MSGFNIDLHALLSSRVRGKLGNEYFAKDINASYMLARRLLRRRALFNCKILRGFLYVSRGWRRLKARIGSDENYEIISAMISGTRHIYSCKWKYLHARAFRWKQSDCRIVQASRIFTCVTLSTRSVFQQHEWQIKILYPSNRYLTFYARAIKNYRVIFFFFSSSYRNLRLRYIQCFCPFSNYFFRPIENIDIP